jgi:Ca2+-binding RTX toxin-like protein
MRKVALLLSVVAAALLIASGVAFAKNIQGDGKDNRLVGTSKNDTIAGSGGDDNIFGKGGRDRLYGDSGADNVSGGTDPDDVFGGKGADDLFGNGGDDYMNSADNRGGDFVDCGPGFDSAVIDAVDFGPPPVFLEVVEGNDTTVNCEDVTTVLTNPGSGTDSGANAPLSTMTEEEVEQAIEDGTLIEVE